MKSIVLVCLSLLVFPLFTHAQGGDPIEQSASILPPSPTASELTRYGAIQVGLSTGTPNVNIPIYVYTHKSITVPISLSYNSNGLKVDQIASWVGLGWSLNAGGVITRTIRDVADEEVETYPFPADFNPSQLESVNYLLAAQGDGFDSEQDLYSFNFLNYSGRFVFDRSGNPIVMPYQQIKIEKITDASGSSFKLTTPDGVLYTFGFVELSQTVSIGTGCGRSYDAPAETAWYLTSIKDPAGNEVVFEYEAPVAYTYKASISESKVRKMYDTGCTTGNCPSYNDKTCVSQLKVIGGYLKRIYSLNDGEVQFAATKTRTDVGDYKLDQIVVKDQAGSTLRMFDFAYAFSTSSGFTNGSTTEELKHRMFLTSVAEKDQAASQLKTHSFDYSNIDQLPPRLSYAQDHWGYFNGASNTTLLPPSIMLDPSGNKLFSNTNANRSPNGVYSLKGMLKRINYPTGGYSDLTYEPNSYWGEVLNYPSTTHASATIIGLDPHIMQSATYMFTNPTFCQPYLSATFTLNSGYTFDAIHDKGYITIKKGTITILDVQMTLGVPLNRYINLEGGYQYTITVSSTSPSVTTNFGFDYYATGPTSTMTNVETGGQRILKVTNYDPISGKNEYTNYYYGTYSNLSHSTGMIGGTPIYDAGTSMSRQICNDNANGGAFTPAGIACGFIDCFFTSLQSNSQPLIYPVGGNNIYYQNVVVGRGVDNTSGLVQHDFIVQFDASGSTAWGRNIPNSSTTNVAWGNSLESAIHYYAYQGGSFVLTKETLNSYVQDNRYSNSVTNLVVRKAYDPVCTHLAPHACTTEETTLQYKAWMCTTSHTHLYTVGGWTLFLTGIPNPTMKVTCIAPGANNGLAVVGSHQCYGKSPGYVFLYPDAIDHLDVVEYQNNAFWFYLASSTEKVYDSNGANPVTTLQEYYYDNPDHGFKTRDRITGSNGKLVELTTWYPKDYANADNLSTLRNNNIINVPVKVQKTVNGMLVEGTITKHTDQGQVKEIYSYSSNQLVAPLTHDTGIIVPSTANYESKGTLTYSANHDLVQVDSYKGSVVNYTWGYNNNYPTAKVINAKATQIYHNSFELTGTAGTARTGDYYNNSGLFTIPFTPPADGATYKMSYWYWNGTAWIFSGELPFNTSISNGTRLDEIRVYPQGAQFSSFAYKIGVGMTSQMDSNGVVTSYEYDGFGRLILIRDDKGKILKSYTYNYQVAGQ